MADAKMLLPVFLPGNNRDWHEVKGVATITDDGEINIKLFHNEDAIDMVKMARTGILYSVAFDYKDPAVKKTTETETT